MSTSKKQQRASWWSALLTRIKGLIDGELNHLLTVNRSQRPWHMPIIAAIAISFPVFVGAYFGDLSSGIKASLGSMIILNLPFSGGLPHRLVTVMAWGFAMILSFALGLIAQLLPVFRLPVFVLIGISVVMLGRYYRQPPPAGLFVLMAGAIALFIPVPIDQVLSAIGLVILGSGSSMLLALFYSLFLLATRPVASVPVYDYQPDMISDSLIVVSFVSLALVIAVLLELPYPYWAAMSCFIIIQGMQLRTMWIKQLHRLLGTLAGMGVAGWMLSWGLSGWGIAIAILCMMFLIESFVDRHYGLAVIFITPLTIFIAEYGSTMSVPPVAGDVIQARMIDTVLGCVIGLSGGLAIHSTRLRVPLRRFENWLLLRFS
ncbi:FUSC family protein [Psychrobacter sp. JCM 18900]|uniref:FUSC family protein n=2 Tax=Psychrobacter sp. JCM 18900 TaxID=1298608 RepID=UPI00191A26B0|nr:FUSC family protein [Psychrobacter sp. JCM 18900]